MKVLSPYVLTGFMQQMSVSWFGVYFNKKNEECEVHKVILYKKIEKFSF